MIHTYEGQGRWSQLACTRCGGEHQAQQSGRLFRDGRERFWFAGRQDTMCAVCIETTTAQEKQDEQDWLRIAQDVAEAAARYRAMWEDA